MDKSGQDKDRCSFTVTEAPWEQYQDAIQQIRNAVFVKEQHIPTELEWDGSDKDCIHVLAHDEQGEPIGTGRIQIHTHSNKLGDSSSVGHIGRIAIFKDWRGFGIGGEILTCLINIAEAQNLASVYLNAQEHLQPYYERYQFVREGKVFEEAGIAHVRMAREIASR